MTRVARKPVNVSLAERKRKAQSECAPAGVSVESSPAKRARSSRKCGPPDGVRDEELERIWDTVQTGLKKALDTISLSKDLSGRFSVTDGEEWVRMYS